MRRKFHLSALLADEYFLVQDYEKALEYYPEIQSTEWINIFCHVTQRASECALKLGKVEKYIT